MNMKSISPIFFMLFSHASFAAHTDPKVCSEAAKELVLEVAKSTAEKSAETVQVSNVSYKNEAGSLGADLYLVETQDEVGVRLWSILLRGKNCTRLGDVTALYAE